MIRIPQIVLEECVRCLNSVDIPCNPGIDIRSVIVSGPNIIVIC